jgi:hypothetical protein
MVFCFGILAYGYFFSKNSTSDFAFLFGCNLPIGLTIWAIFYSIVGRKQDRVHAAISLFAIFGSLIAAGLIGYSQQKSAAIQAINEIQKGYSSIVGSTTNSSGVPKQVEGPLNTTPTVKGEMGELERFMKTFMNQMASQRNDYMLELGAIGWEKILDPERVRSDKTLIESKTIIKNAKDIVSKYKQKASTLLDKARKDIASLDLSESSKQALKDGFERGMAKSAAQIEAVWDMRPKLSLNLRTSLPCSLHDGVNGSCGTVRFFSLTKPT